MGDRSDYKATWQGLSGTVQAAMTFVSGSTDEDAWQQSGLHSVAVLERYVGIRPTDVFLEIGCGAGRVGAALSSRCAEWVGTDISANMLGHARSRLKGLKNVRFVELSEVGLKEIPDSSIDVVYCTVVFMHLYEWDRFRYLQEAFRVLRPGGRCFFDNVDILSGHGWQVFTECASLPPAHRPAQLAMMSSGDELFTYATKAGFTDVKIHRWDDAWVGVAGVKP